jgi:two-component system, NarL family, nitrate/nitrite response regulator NarL
LVVTVSAVQRRHRTPPLGLLIVTPVKLYRDGIAHFLRSSNEVCVLGTADESTDTVRLVCDLVPDVVLLDMALENSRATARAMRAALPQATIVALAIPESEGYVVSCAEAGISAYVPRDGALEELLETILRAAEGEAVCTPEIAGGLFRRVATLASQHESPPAEDRTIERLTARETEVIALIDDGLSNQQIARRLCIEVPTVKNHVHSILDKLGASSRGEAAARARMRVR